MIDLTEPPARTGSAAPVGGAVRRWLPAEEAEEEEEEADEEEEEEDEVLRSSAEVKTTTRMVKSSAGTRKSGSRSMMEVRARASELRREDQLDSAAHRGDVTLPVSL